MQLIGIYIEDNCETKVIKNLSEKWYSFGDFSNCKNTDPKKILQKIKNHRKFINKLYNIDQTDNSGPSINLNCIVGKNGSGKSTLLALLYRIINNLACKLKEVLPDYNIDFEPQWAWGFNASLYYELNDKIGRIEITDNEKFENGDYNKDRKKNLPVRVIFDSNDIFTHIENNKSYIKELGKYLFYTIGTNYSLYSNIRVRNEFEDIHEKWLYKIYHKNDGYFTPIVLVPYREDSSIIDTEKELKLANERVNTLAILIKATDESNFVENITPSKVLFKLKREEDYKKEIINKTARVITGKDLDEKKIIYNDFDDVISKSCNVPEGVINYIQEIWKKKLDKRKKITDEVIYNNILLYLTYKTIKMSMYYDKYITFFEKNILVTYDRDIFNEDDIEQTVGEKKIEDFIQFIINEKIDFTNLKIKQCIYFLEHGEFYLKNEDGTYIDDLFVEHDKPIQEIINNLQKSNVKNYDNIFLNLLPPIFYKQYLYQNGEKDDIPISSMSSGEQQMLYSLSYVVYHMKNAASNQNIQSGIPYRNINLLFDEAELYYHPEYQRQFIDKLLGILKRSHLENEIDSINITIVTHSPFILSDIPNSNILALKEGKRESFKTNTLGANIYDLLNNQFFMDSAIGSHVEEIIKEIIKDYYLFQEDDSKKEEIKNKYLNTDSEAGNNFYDTLIEQIGDEYLHDTLFDMVNQIKEISFSERRIKEYETKIERLKNEKN